MACAELTCTPWSGRRRQLGVSVTFSEPPSGQWLTSSCERGLEEWVLVLIPQGWGLPVPGCLCFCSDNTKMNLKAPGECKLQPCQSASLRWEHRWAMRPQGKEPEDLVMNSTPQEVPNSLLRKSLTALPPSTTSFTLLSPHGSRNCTESDKAPHPQCVCVPGSSHPRLPFPPNPDPKPRHCSWSPEGPQQRQPRTDPSRQGPSAPRRPVAQNPKESTLDDTKPVSCSPGWP